MLARTDKGGRVIMLALEDNYTGTETFQILLKGREAASVVEDWTERNIQTDIRLRRAKTKGCVVVETKDVIFARNIIVWYPGCQVVIKKG